MNQFSQCYLFLLLIVPIVSQAQNFPFTDKEKPLQIVYSKSGPKLDSIAAHLLANDIKLATNTHAQVVTNAARLKGNVIVIGNIESPLVKPYFNVTTAAYKKVKGKWETYAWKVIDRPKTGISKLLVIAGSDARGTAYGVFSLSEKLGVSPWYWWADVPVTMQKNVTLKLKEQSSSPRIKFRGIFINDEDWGLQPWAAKTFEPETGDIGPKTYAKVFELILRLKGNLIWPAMHPCTKAFFHYPGNKKVAEDYSIVIGTSHAEPMLRNNVGEWDEKSMGHFNYVINKEKVYNYWENRVKETTTNDVLYTMGMRGVHDS
ncbi:MAG TPA: glycosyl hydrolase 115 family protein, partial [Niastella sp.]|nr:glycosyl hydrolase 115 family protein [Niastella sp.]